MMIFDLDIWSEVWQSLSKNKTRTLLTAFGVGWGLLMIIVMIGAGNGLQNGVTKEFSGFASNSAFLWSSRTSMPYQGFDKGRRISFTNGDIDYLKENLNSLEYLAPRNQLGGWRGGNNVTFKNNSGAFSVYGDFPEILHVTYVDVFEGRFLNDLDLQNERKIAVIGKRVKDILFAGENEIIGKFINIQGVPFMVVGIFSPVNSGQRADDLEQSIFVPFTTFQKAFNMPNKVSWFAMTSKPDLPATVLEEEAKELLAQKHHVHPNDKRAFGSFNAADRFKEMSMVFTGIDILTWFVGSLTLLAGVIGISNIMLVSIKERTREIGVRRAIGATPNGIISQILLESVSLTFLAGYAGILIGLALIEGASYYLKAYGIKTEYFDNPQVDFNTVIMAFCILLFCGALAGVFPAYRALNIKPVDALRTE